MKNNVSVVLNCFKRPHTLRLQYNSIVNQTIIPDNIFIWQNQGDAEKYAPLDKEVADICVTSVSNSNFGVWARFAYALNCRTEYILVLDDDTIIQPKFIENCLETMKIKEGLLGTIGVIFDDLDYCRYRRVGWDAPNDNIEQVDICGHAWFFKREHLGAFWRENEIPIHHLSGEDVHFSYAVQKYLNLPTLIPPHPISNKDLWGSDPNLAWKFGVDNVAISTTCHHQHFGNNLKHYKQKGFRFLNNL